jgi:hypothetical protein
VFLHPSKNNDDDSSRRGELRERRAALMKGWAGEPSIAQDWRVLMNARDRWGL